MEDSNKLSKKIFKGSLIYSARQVIVTILGLVTTLTITRILQPADFGYVSFVTIILSSMTLLSDGGLGVYLIQKKAAIDSNEISLITNLQLIMWSVFQISILLIYVIMLNVSDKDVKGLVFLFAASFSIPIAIFKAGSIINLERTLNFKKIAIIETGEQLTFTIVAIALALLNFGVWGIVLANLAKVCVSFSIARYLAPWKYSFSLFNKKMNEIISLLKKGISYQLPAILETLRAALNPILIGFVFGMKFAGFTDRAILIASIPTSFLGAIWQRILFPLFARIQDDKAKLESTFNLSVYLHSILDKALYLPLILFGPQIITYILGDKWLPSFPVFVIFSIGNCFFAGYSSTIIAFLKGMGLPRVLAYWSFIQFPLALVSVALFSHFFGFIGYAMGSQMLWFGIIYFSIQMKKHVNISVFRSILTPLIAFAASFLCMKYVFVKFHDPTTFVLPSISCLILYFIFLFIMDFRKIFRMLPQLKNK